MLRNMLVSAFVLFTAACSQTPNHLIVAPVYQDGKLADLPLTLAISVTDTRKTPALKVLGREGTSSLETVGLKAALSRALETALTQQGVTLNPASQKMMQLEITHLEAVVAQSTVKHTMEAVLELKVSINTQNGTFSKLYNGQSQFEAPLNYDVAKVEAELNKSFESLLRRIMTDAEIHAALKG